MENAGLSRIRFHDLRHTAASLILNNGVPVLVVSKMLGHSKPSVTLDIYGRLYLEKQDEAAKVIDEVGDPHPSRAIEQDQTKGFELGQGEVELHRKYIREGDSSISVQ